VRAARVVDAIAVTSEPGPTSPPGWSDAPPGESRAPSEAVHPPTGSADDDDTRVRQAIERFRQTYNARLASHHDVRPGGPLAFERCDIAIAGDEAAASCTPARPSPDDRAPRTWDVTLKRVESGWAIDAIQSP
jgi:hypothetical protein